MIKEATEVERENERLAETRSVCWIDEGHKKRDRRETLARTTSRAGVESVESGLGGVELAQERDECSLVAWLIRHEGGSIVDWLVCSLKTELVLYRV